MIFLLIFLLVLSVIWLLAFLLVMGVIWGMLTSQVPFVPTHKKIVNEIEKLMPLRSSDIFYDLGSGDGRVVLEMAYTYPAATIIGVEKTPVPFFLAYIRRWRKPAKNAMFLFKDFDRVDLTNATHVYMYLFPQVVQDILPKFQKELRPGTQVISCDFPFNAKEPKEKIEIFAGRKHTLYVYEF